MPSVHPSDSQSVAVRHPLLEKVMPFAGSLTIHVGVVLIGLATYGTVKTWNAPGTRPSEGTGTFITSNTPSDFRPIFERPDAKGNMENPKGSLDGLIDATDSALSSPSGGGSLHHTLVGSNESPDFSGLIAMGKSTLGGGPNGPGSGPGPAGTGDGPGGFSRLGDPNGTEIGLLAPPKSARSVVFVCDASGSMMNKMGILKLEMQKTINSLRLTQAFGVIFFQEGRPAMLGSELLLANPGNKRKAASFLDDVSASGSTEPLAGLEAAFKLKPQAIVLLTDGDFPDNTAVIERIRQLNKGQAIQVNTIAFTGRRDTERNFLKVLETIAKENRGTFKHVQEDQLP